jgi:hypothetical protein
MIWDKIRSYWEHFEEHIGNLGTCWELIGSLMGTTKIQHLHLLLKENKKVPPPGGACCLTSLAARVVFGLPGFFPIFGLG